MPWRETCAMRERLKFVALVEAGEETMAELCRRFGISRKTGYKFMERFAAQGIAGLCERSHAPHQHPHAVCEEIEQRVVELRGEHPFWGPRKLRARLRMLDGAVAWPAASTIGEILRRHRLIIPRKTRARVPADTSPFAACMGANDTWSIDFKGWFRTGDGRRCEPLTISDAYSRYLLRCQVVRRADTRWVKPLVEATLREYGLPRVIRSDNGPPFCQFGRRRSVPALGVVDQARHQAGTDRTWPAQPERPSRAAARDAQARGLPAPGRQPARPAAAVRCLPPRLQRRAAA